VVAAGGACVENIGKLLGPTLVATGFEKAAAAVRAANEQDALTRYIRPGDEQHRYPERAESGDPSTSPSNLLSYLFSHQPSSSKSRSRLAYGAFRDGKFRLSRVLERKRDVIVGHEPFIRMSGGPVAAGICRAAKRADSGPISGSIVMIGDRPLNL